MTDAQTEAQTRAHIKVCVIGAGCSGITTAKRLKEHGIDYDQFELCLLYTSDAADE